MLVRSLGALSCVVVLAIACGDAGNRQGADATSPPSDAVAPPTDAMLADDVMLADDAMSDGAGPPPARPHDELPVAACGMPAYELIDPDELGAVLLFEALPFWDRTAAQLNALVTTATGYSVFTLPYGVKIWRLRYTTQDRGEAVEATALVVVPRGDGALDGPLPIALHAHGYSGNVDECAPSHPDHNMVGPMVPALFGAMGFVVVAPDYIGMNGFGEGATVRHAYLVGEQVALGSWDAVRAARAALLSLDTPVRTAPRVIPWGGSQGGHGALFIEHYGPYYAPEFEVPGVIALVPPIDLLPIWRYSAAVLRASSGLFTMTLATMNEWYGRQGDLRDVLTNEEPYFIADNIVETIYPVGQCSIPDVPEVSEASEVFTAESIAAIAAADWDALAPWSCYYRENSLPHTSVPPRRFTPTLVVYSENDELVLPEEVRGDFEHLCERGWPLEYLECAGAGHTEGAAWSLPEQLAWAQARLAGEPLAEERRCAVAPPTICSLSPEPE